VHSDDTDVNANAAGTPWLNTRNFTTAIFDSKTVTKTDSGYAAKGTLTLCGITQDFTLPFTLAINGDMAKATAHATLARLDFGVGKTEDPSGSTISKDIIIDITLNAHRLP